MIPERCAVLGIDLQNEYRGEGAYPVEGYDGILANAARLEAAARAAAVPLVHVQAWTEAGERRRYALLDDGLADGLRSGVAGSYGAALCEEVAPLTGEHVLRKRWPSAFQETGLESLLRRLGAESLVVFGVWTDSCVRASVFDAVYRGFRVWLVKDACGSATRTMHRAATLDMANRLYGGGIVDTAAAIEALAGRPHAAWRCSRPVEFAYTLEALDSLYEGL